MRPAIAALGILLALAGCKKREPGLPATPHPKAKLAYRVGNCVYMDLNHTGVPDRGRCFGLPGEPMLAADFDGNGTTDLAVRRGRTLLIDTANDGQRHEMALDLGDVRGATHFIAADFVGNAARPAPASVTVVRGHRVRVTPTWGAVAELSFGEAAGQYFAGRWRSDGPARLGLHQGHCVVLDEDGDSRPETGLCYVELGPIDQVLVGDWNGDGRDDLLLRRGACVSVDTKLNGTISEKQCLGEGKRVTDYFAGSWDGK